MGLDKGLLYLAFGETYDTVAAYSIRYSRKFTDLPICVLTNLNESQRHPLWKDIDNIQFIELDIPTDYNRNVKTSLVEYTPFDQTIFVDCDAVIQNPGIETMFDLLRKHDVMFQYVKIIEGKVLEHPNIIKHYLPTMGRLAFDPPIRIYHSGLFGFKKNKRTIKLFRWWNRYWKEGTDCGRDMPPLACVLHKFQNEGWIKLNQFTAEDLWFCEGSCKCPFNPNAIVQHRFRPTKTDNFFKKFSIPKYKTYKPFDR